LQLAKEFGITVFPSPAGGCLLTCEEYAKKLCDLFTFKTRVSVADVALLRLGRHFRVGGNKFVVGRNEGENKELLGVRGVHDFCFELPDFVGPVTILQGVKSKAAIYVAARLTAFYSDAAKTGKVRVNYGKGVMDRSVIVERPSREEVEALRVGQKSQ